MRMVFQVAGGILLALAVVLLIIAVGSWVPPSQGGTVATASPATTTAGPVIADYAREIAARCHMSAQAVQADADYARTLGATLGTPPDTGAMYAWVATVLPDKPAWETCGQVFDSFANPSYVPSPLPVAARQGDGGS